jgi:hypothetical protein
MVVRWPPRKVQISIAYVVEFADAYLGGRGEELRATEDHFETPG